MRELEVNGTKYGLKEWKDLTLEQAQALIDYPIPEPLKVYFDDGKGGFTVEQELNEFPRYYVEVILMLTDIPRHEFDRVKFGYFNHVHYITDFFYRHCLEYLLALLHGPTFQGTGKREFIHHGQGPYLFPTEKKIADMIIPLENETAATFVESTQLMSAMFGTRTMGIKNMALLTAILCRKKGEEYNEQVALQRAEEFKDLPMDVIWDVFFYTLHGLTLSAQRSAILSAIIPLKERTLSP
jgi:hypothetical protein